jgi:hypothetical protein
MGILAPLFLASLAALSAPLIFHLVRRTPRGRQEFSSLMFLRPTPPRLTRRSRLDQILLLLLRLAALALLGFAFTRPFLRESKLLSVSDLPRRRVAILIDNSASMRRGDLWQQALAAARSELDDLAPQDDVALLAYSDHLQTAAPFPSETLAATESAIDVARSELKKLRPTWQIGDLGLALTTLAGELDAASDVQQALADPQIVVISDFQKGTRLDALTAYDWPERVRIIPRPLTLAKKTNASVQLLVNREDSQDVEPRVRVTNAADSQGDQFFVRWADQRKDAGKDTAIYVPPDESRVLRLPRRDDNLQSDRVVLRGDDQDFDNQFYVVPPRKQEITLIYAGNDAADDAQGLQYYLRLACEGDPLRHVTIREIAKEQPFDFAGSRIVVATRKLSEQELVALQGFVASGGVLLFAPADESAATALPQWFDDIALEKPKELREDDFVLLGEIDFTHPLFAPLAGPRYNDFTKIHFWRLWPVSLKAEAKTSVLARFDDRSPWLLSRSLGQGQLFACTSSWSPDDSQLAVSSKFVPLINNLLDIASGSTRPLEGVTIGDAVPLASGSIVTTPSGSKLQSEDGDGKFAKTTEPGIYRVAGGEAEQAFAVNLPVSESDTAVMQMEQLDQLGVRRTAAVASQQRLSRMRQQRDTELEGRQKVWRWLLVGSLLFLIGECLWAGIAARPAAQNLEIAA